VKGLLVERRLSNPAVFQESVVSLSQASDCLSGLGVSWEQLLPHLAGVVVEGAELAGARLVLRARGRAGQAACPLCGRLSGRVHSRYGRRLADAAIGGRPVVICLTVRRLFCGNPGCPRTTFAEQVEGLTRRYARRTGPLAAMLGAVAVALAGRAGSRLAAVLGMLASRSSLLRLLMAWPDPPAGPVTVLGIDDFAFARGRRYGTLLMDMQAGVPVDVLPDREAATAEAWLREHPEVEVICRDRAGAYARAARAAAPAAIQVADRWHIWHNLAEHARDAVARHRHCLPSPAQPAPAADPHTVIGARHQAIHQLRAAGRTQAQAAAELGLSRQLTGRYWRAPSPAALLAARATSALDPYKPYLRARWDQGTTNITALLAEITQQGYPGSYTTLHAWLGQLNLAAPAKPPAPPDTGQVTTWILTDPAHLDPAAAAALAGIRARCPELDALARHIAAFAAILTGLHGDQLDTWIAAVDADPAQPDLHAFTHGIRQDHQAVRNGLTLPWNSGKVEGTVNKIKMLKRQTYGRAGFPLLRKRILLTSRNTSP
jgi:transposase